MQADRALTVQTSTVTCGRSRGAFPPQLRAASLDTGDDMTSAGWQLRFLQRA